MAIKHQNGFTLLEMMLVIGLLAGALLLKFYADEADAENYQARRVGLQLFEYNSAVQRYLAKHNDIANANHNGSAWLKNTTCGGMLAKGSEYLPCSFPAATILSPFKYSQISLSTTISVTGTGFDRKITASTATTPFTVAQYSNMQVRADLAGIAAITAAAGGMGLSKFTGAPSVLSDSSFTSNPRDGTITMNAFSRQDEDIWLRTDGGNDLHANLVFDSPNGLNRQIIGASRLQNIAAQLLSLGSPSGIAPLSGAKVILDSNAELIGPLRIRNNLTVDNGAAISGVLAATGNITAGGTLMGQIFYDANNTGYYVDPSSLSNINALHAQTIRSMGRFKAGEYVAIGGTASQGQACTPNGLMGKDVFGKIMSCQGGAWAGNGGDISDPEQLFSGQTGSGTCITFTKNAMVTLTGPGTNTMKVNGVVVGRTYNYGGQYTDVASDSSISHMVGAGEILCTTNTVVDYGLVITSGVKVVASYLN